MLCALWGFIFMFPALQKHWKTISIIGVVCNTVTGTPVVIFLGTFGFAGDITAKSPYKQQRPWLFALLESIIGCTAVISAKLSGILLGLPLYYTLFGITAILWTVSLFTMLFLPNPIPLSVQKQRIRWKNMFFLVPLYSCLPTRANRERFRQKAKRTSDSKTIIDELSSSSNLLAVRASSTIQASSSPHRASGGAIAAIESEPRRFWLFDWESDEGCDDTDNDTACSTTTSALSSTFSVISDPQFVTSVANTPALPHTPIHNERTTLLRQSKSKAFSTSDLFTPRKQSSLATTDPSDVDTPSEALLGHTYSSSSQSNAHNTQQSEVSPATQSNTVTKQLTHKRSERTPPFIVPFLCFSLFSTFFSIYGRKTVTFAYYKIEYDISSRDYTNILFFYAVGNGIAVLVIVPLIKRLLMRSESSLKIELWSSFFALLVEAACFGLLPFLPTIFHAGGGIHNNRIWISYILWIVAGLASAIPAGVLRSAIMNVTFRPSQQQRMLATITVIEGICLCCVGLVLNKVYQLAPFIGTAFVVISGVSLLGILSLGIAAIIWTCSLHTDDDDFVAPINTNSLDPKSLQIHIVEEELLVEDM